MTEISFVERAAEAQALLEKGLTPYHIAKKMGIPWNKALGYLYIRVRDGYLRRSDIMFSISPERRTAIKTAIKEHESTAVSQILQMIKDAGNERLWESPEEMRADATVVSDFYFVLKRSQLSFLGEIYADLCDIEVRLFDFIVTRLRSEFGERDTEWWVNSVPERTRQACATRQEQDGLAYPREAYLDLIDLREILDRNWRLFREPFAKVSRDPNFKKHLMADMLALNKIRNKIMHPLRKAILNEEEFELVRSFSKKIHVLTKDQTIRWIG